jgi:hypothetical protein
MQIIVPDFDRRIDLPGVGPCPRPVDIDQSVTGFADLVSLRIYGFTGTATINGEAEGDEVLIVLIAGSASIRVTGDHQADYRLSVEGIRAIYLPPEHHYQLTPEGKADIAYARAKPQSAKPPASFAGPELAIMDYADRLQMRLAPLGKTGGRIATDAGNGVERLAFVTHRASSGGTQLAAWHTLVLSKGEAAELTGSGEALIVASR